MKRGAPMKRTGFARPARPENLPVSLSPAYRAGTYAGTTSGVVVDKAAPVRSEAYRRAVAALGCIHCGRAGPSQCAHANTGKGMSMKACDLESFPLCVACHRAFDQGALFDKAARRTIEPQWARATRSTVIAAGAWPANLPLPIEHAQERQAT